MKLQEVINDNSFDYKFLYKKMWPYAKPYLGRAIIGILVAIPVGLLDGVTAYAVKPFFDEVIVKKNQSLLCLIPLGIVLFTLIQGILRYLNIYLNDWVGKKITNDIRKELYSKLVNFESSFYDQNQSGIIIQRFSADAFDSSSGLINNFKTLVTQFFGAIGLSVVLILNSWKLAVIAVGVLVFSIVPMKFLRSRIKMISQGQMELGGRVFTHFNETIAGNKIVSSYNLQEPQYNKFESQANEHFDLTMKLTKSVSWVTPSMNLVAAVGLAIVMWYGAHLVATDTITAGTFFSFLTALLLLYKPIKTLAPTLTNMQTNFVAMNRVVDLFDVDRILVPGIDRRSLR